MVRILVVEDDHETRLLLSGLLARSGYTVEAVADGTMALGMMAAKPPDLVLLDAQLPGIDGWEVCRQVKRDARTKDIPILILTGHAGPETYDLTITTGADEFMTKPFRSDRLLAAIAKLLDA